MSTDFQPQNLVSLVAYQEGAVISRELVRNTGGTITLFAFDKDQGLSEHTAPFDALVQALDGRADITINSQNFTIESGQFLILPARQPHSVTALTRFKMILTMIKSA